MSRVRIHSIGPALKIPECPNVSVCAEIISSTVPSMVLHFSEKSSHSSNCKVTLIRQYVENTKAQCL